VASITRRCGVHALVHARDAGSARSTAPARRLGFRPASADLAIAVRPASVGVTMVGLTLASSATVRLWGLTTGEPEGSATVVMESLILAQDERWRRT